MGVAPGNDATQAGAYKKQLHISFPVVPDKEGEVYYALRIPTLPFMIIADTEGKVLMSHSGIIQDPEQMLRDIRALHKQQ